MAGLSPTGVHPTARLRIAQAQYGIVLSDIAASIVSLPAATGTLPALRIPWFRGELFDGRVSGGPLTIDLNDPAGEFDLHLENLDVARIVATQNVDGLQASGRLDGVLPVSLDSQGVRVRDGALQGNSPGTINYRGRRGPRPHRCRIP